MKPLMPCICGLSQQVLSIKYVSLFLLHVSYSNVLQYKICHFIDGQLARETHDMVTFQINDVVVEGSSTCIEKMKANPDQFLPDPKLLTLHATCAKVAHLSGAAEVLDEWERDLEEKKVLAADGSDMDMFNYALIGLVQVEVN